MNPVALSNPIPQSKSLATPYTYLGRGEMADILSPHTCSLCGVVITNFRIVHPIIRHDDTRPYFHRTGRNRGLSPERRIGWSCGKHRTIDPNWLENSYEIRVDTIRVTAHTPAMLSTRQEIHDIRDRLGLSREKFGALIGVSGNTIFKWEHGDNPVSEPALRLARRILMENRETESA